VPLIAKFMTPALQGDKSAALTVLRLMGRESRLLGLDATTKPSTPESPADELANMDLDQLRELARRHGIPVQEDPELTVTP
jgi:hypothetical protein